MKFISTRGGEKVTGAKAVVQGLAKNGGLFVPEKFPCVSGQDMEQMLGMSYPERAAFILSKFFDEYYKKELLASGWTTAFTYSNFFTAPLARSRIWR